MRAIVSANAETGAWAWLTPPRPHAASAAVVAIASGKPTASMAKQGGYAVLAKRTLHAAIKLIKLGGARCQVMLIACPRHVRAEAVAERYGFRHRYAVHGRRSSYAGPSSILSASFTVRRHHATISCCAGKCDARARSALGDCVRARPCTIEDTSYEKRTHVARSHTLTHSTSVIAHAG